MGRTPPVNPDGNERLTSSVGLILIVLSLAEILTLLVGLQETLHLHVILGLMLIPPVALKLGSTGWRFARYYTRNAAYREKGAPQLLMRALAPLFVAATVALFGSGVAMGIVHGNALSIARRIHGPASVVWMLLLGAHVLVYTRRAFHAVAADVRARTRRAVTGARWRTIIVLAAIACGVVAGLATLPDQHPWLHLSSRHHHRDR